MYKDYDKLPPNFFMTFTNLIQQELKNAADGKKSVDAALDKAQAEGQLAMTQELAKAKNQPDAGASPSTGGDAPADGDASSSATATTDASK